MIPLWERAGLRRSRLTVEHLPAYAPDLNPDEHFRAS